MADYISNHSGEDVDNAITKIKEINYTSSQINSAISTINNLLNKIYPIGSIYISVSNVNPSTFIGGTWQRIQDKFLLAAGSSYAAGSTGGNATHTHTTAGHTLTVSEIPAHYHVFPRQQWYGSDSTTNVVGSIYSWKSGTGGTTSSGYLGSADQAKIYGSTGGGGSHSHGNTGNASTLPPYLAVYVWQRTA